MELVGEVAVVEEERMEVSESVLDWRERRRKGMEGRRKVGKRVGVGCRSEVLRRKDMVMIGIRALKGREWAGHPGQ